MLTALLLTSSCDDNKSNPVSARPEPEICQAEQWDEDTGGWYAYTHDCEPFEGVHFTIYSDGSSLAAKEQLAGLAEGIFNQLVPEFMVEDIAGELDFTEGYTYYIYADQAHGHGAGMADMRDLFQLMKEGQGFKEAFEEAMGMSVKFFGDNFYELMETYLRESGQEGSGDLEGEMGWWEGVGQEY